MRILAIFTLLISSLVALAADRQVEIFTLDHQMSQMCQKKIMQNMRFEKGVSNIDVSLKENTITITFDPEKTDAEKLIAGFKKIGFNAMVCSPDETSANEKDTE